MRKKMAGFTLAAFMAASLLTGCRESPVANELFGGSSQGQGEGTESYISVEGAGEETPDAGKMMVFNYNGAAYTLPSPSTVFTDDGWSADYGSSGYSMPATDNEFGYISLGNQAYAGVQCRLYSCQEYTGAADTDEVTAEIEGYGVGGIYMSVIAAESTKPAFSVGGITWGSQPEEITEAFGTPTSADSGMDSATYCYEVTESGMKYSLTFIMDGNGVYAIMVKNQAAAG